ncbi:MarR family winged helix-turn-helix transcriptional regulator [Phyllobacterium sp. K27]
MTHEILERVPLILEEFTPYRLNKAAETISRRFSSQYREQYGLTRPEWRTLATLGQFGAQTATAIGVHSSMHKTKVSRAVYALEQRRWLKRRRDEADRRTEHLELTPAGLKAYEHLARLAHGFETDLFAKLGERGARDLKAGLAALETYYRQSMSGALTDEG